MVSLDDETKAALQPAAVPRDLAESVNAAGGKADPRTTEPRAPSVGEAHVGEAHGGEAHAGGAYAGEVPVGGAHAAADGASVAANESSTETPASAPASREFGPSFVFFGIVAAASLVLDIGSKVWAEVTLNRRGLSPISVIEDHLNVTLAYNQGGAWGLLSTTSEAIRKPFFLIVSAAAVIFIISLYSRLHPSQKALKWGLPLVLGGALGNLSDRITRSQVIDFIDYRADWVMHLNAFVAQYVPGWTITDHWPTFNVADIAICIGVGLMAVDMFTHRRPSAGEPVQSSRSFREQEAASAPLVPPASTSESTASNTPSGFSAS